MRLWYAIHVEKPKMRVYCDIKAERVFAHISVRTERGPKRCAPIPALLLQENYHFLSFIMFFFTVRADGRFCSKP